MSATASNIVALFSSAPVLATRGENGVEKIINPLCGSSGQFVPPWKDKLGDVFGSARKVDYKTVEAVFYMLLTHGVLRGMTDAMAGEPKWATNPKYLVRNVSPLVGCVSCTWLGRRDFETEPQSTLACPKLR